MSSEKTRKCAFCGKELPDGAERYCSGLCRTTASSMAAKDGGRMGEKASAGRYPRVEAMLKLPPERRWEISRDFTEDERRYARTLSLREDRLDQFLWGLGSDGAQTGSEDGCLELGGDIGTSDDGTV